MGAYHAVKSPSSAHRWTSCTASVGAQVPFRGVDDSNPDARQGTCCHQIAEEVLAGSDLQGYLGRVMDFYARGGPVVDCWRDSDEPRCDNLLIGSVTVTQEMIDAVASATAYVQQQIALTGGHLLVEQRVPIGHFTGEEGATGSADVIIL